MKKVSDSEWRKKLTSEEFAVLRQKNTERPFTGKLLNNKSAGTYNCAACGAELFSSDVKFDSGTGWPSFWDAKKGAVDFHEDNDHGMRRVEVTCANCGGHLGHVFPDGPQDKTGKRFCINSCALHFNSKGKNA